MATADYTDDGIDPESGLKLRERLAVDHYLSSMNATKAFHAAGYAAATYGAAREAASQLFARPDIHSYLDQRLKGRAANLRVSSDRVLLELCVTAFSKIDMFAINPDTGAFGVKPGIPAEFVGAVRSVETSKETTVIVRANGDTETKHVWTAKWVLWDKLKALQLLAMHLGLVSAELPPLEVLLNRLPAHVADILRHLLAMPKDERERLRAAGQQQAIPGTGGGPA